MKKLFVVSNPKSFSVGDTPQKKKRQKQKSARGQKPTQVAKKLVKNEGSVASREITNVNVSLFT